MFCNAYTYITRKGEIDYSLGRNKIDILFDIFNVRSEIYISDIFILNVTNERIDLRKRTTSLLLARPGDTKRPSMRGKRELTD